jgi:hypothetical protein
MPPLYGRIHLLSTLTFVVQNMIIVQPKSGVVDCKIEDIIPWYLTSGITSTLSVQFIEAGSNPADSTYHIFKFLFEWRFFFVAKTFAPLPPFFLLLTWRANKRACFFPPPFGLTFIVSNKTILHNSIGVVA